MASPQKENGYTAIANEIMDALTTFRIPGELRQVLDFILRKTYGFNKLEDAISLSQFEKATDIKKNSICRALNLLREHNFIKKSTGYITVYSFNKDFHNWIPFTKRRPSQKGELGSHNIVKKGVTKKRHTKDNITKDNIQKTLGEAPNEVSNLIQFFKETVNPHIDFGNKTQRKCSEELIKAYGLEKTKQALLFLEEKRKIDRYLPLVTTPYELLNKWAKIKQHLTIKKRKIWKTTSHLSPSLPDPNIK